MTLNNSECVKTYYHYMNGAFLTFFILGDMHEDVFYQMQYKKFII
jgi:hypothetical protein